jgi:hypothetical protein
VPSGVSTEKTVTVAVALPSAGLVVVAQAVTT